MSIDWSFPSNNYGTLNGIGEAGIETFKGSPYRSLAREICQNSLDARLDTSKPVTVEFSNIMTDSTDVPKISVLKDALKSCLDFWKEQNSKKTVDFFKNALGIATSKQIPVLRISDFNTTGLTGSDKEYNTPWQNLVKASGVSDKDGASGGSFGIGKSAPFACSDLRTVFYSTLDINGLKAFQGVARLVSFRKRGLFGQDTDNITTGTGYFGETKKNSAIKDCISLDKSFSRDESGTDVFVLGFSNNPGWNDDIVRTVLEDFLISVYNRDLVAKVDDITISADSLPELIDKYRESAPIAYNYYQVLTSQNSDVIEQDFNGLGKIKLHILIQNGLHRRVQMCRSNGMRIFDQKSISGTIPFAGICVLKDEAINAYFREMENPQHDAWEPERHSNSSKAKKDKQELYKFIKNAVIERGRNTPVDEIDADGVGEFLPDEISFAATEGEKKESVADTTKNIDISVSTFQPAQKATEHYEYKDGSEIIDALGKEEELSSGDIGGKSAHDDGQNSTNIGGGFGSGDGTGPGVNGEGDNPFSLGSNADFHNQIIHRKFEVNLMNVRLFVTDMSLHKYRLVFTPSKSADTGFIQFQLSGEQNSVDVTVSHASLVSSGKRLICKDNKIEVGSIEAKQKISIDFIVDYTEQSSMEVKLYGYTVKTLSVSSAV